MNKIREVLFQSMKKKKSTQKNDFSIGVVVSVSPLKVRLYGSSVSIPCQSLTSLLNLEVGCKVVLLKYGKQYIAVGVIGIPGKSMIPGAYIESKRAIFAPETIFHFKSEYTRSPVICVSLTYDFFGEQKTINHLKMSPQIELLTRLEAGVLYYYGARVVWVGIGNNIPDEIEGAFTNIIAVCEVHEEVHE